MKGVRAALRISRRNARRSKGRSALILAMIALPVTLVTFALTAVATVNAGSDAQLRYPLGRADALVMGARGWHSFTQNAVGENIPGGDGSTPLTEAEIATRLDPGSRAIPVSQAYVRYVTPQGYESGFLRQVDLRDPLSRGTFRLTEGRLPAAPGEAVVSARRGGPDLAPGVTLFTAGERRPLRVVGVVLLAPAGNPPDLVVFPGSLPDAVFGPVDPGLVTRGWLVAAPHPVTWPDVWRLNERGLLVLSKAVAEQSPPRFPMTAWTDTRSFLEAVPWIGMALLQVVLSAGPAFAIGRRRRASEFALVAVQGGSPAQLRAIALADGLLFGVAATGMGVALGIGVAALAMPGLEVFGGALAGPFTVPWATVGPLTALGVVAGLLAALAPAVAASRTDATAVLSGRRERRRDRAGRPLLGAALVAVGVAGAAMTARRDTAWIAAAALCIQLGLVAVVPTVVTVAGRLAARLPLPLRFAARDAARNRGRTAPAVAAVMTAVTALTALGVVMESRIAQEQATNLYFPRSPLGTLTISGPDLTPQLWERVRAAVRAELPAGVPLIEARTLATTSGVPLSVSMPLANTEAFRRWHLIEDLGGTGGLFVSDDERLLRYVLGREDPAAVAALRGGKAVVLDPAAVEQGHIRLDVWPGSGLGTGDRAPLTLPAVGVRAAEGQGWARAVVSPETVEKKGYRTAPAMLLVDPAGFRTPKATADRIAAEVEAISAKAEVRLETPPGPGDQLPLVVLGIAAAVLVLGMTFVATMLAAAEARPDLETMSAVGAAPRVKRAIVGGQALVIALLGSVMGVLAGFAPGIAAARPSAGETVNILGPDGLTMTTAQADVPVFAIPWALVGLLVVVLPLLAALGGAAFTRSRLPLPGRRAT
ncbi:FtsX-like permease family protein [Microbispora sp. NPDC046933]|uniref:FtsX-like permease family protein n=1 Tax=Microbispora sp. NPDC046933 TaxID=3155618 RepID=UPI0033C4C4A9